MGEQAREEENFETWLGHHGLSSAGRSTEVYWESLVQSSYLVRKKLLLEVLSGVTAHGVKESLIGFSGQITYLHWGKGLNDRKNPCGFC